MKEEWRNGETRTSKRKRKNRVGTLWIDVELGVNKDDFEGRERWKR